MTEFPTYRLYGEKTDASADFWIHTETVPKRTRLHNWHIERHRHDGFFQLFWLSAGQGEIAELSGQRQFHAPCAILVPPGAIHGFSFTRDVDGLVMTAMADRLRSLSAADRSIAALASATRILAIDPEADSGAEVGHAMHRLHAELHGQNPCRLLLLEPLMISAIVALARCGAIRQDDGLPAGDRDQQRIEQLTMLIAAHMRQHRSLDYYARTLGISAAHLNRIARQRTGMTVQGLIAQRLVEAARRDLVFTPTPVQTIAYSLGFADPAYFSRYFRRHTGLTPGAFRSSERKRLAQ